MFLVYSVLRLSPSAITTRNDLVRCEVTFYGLSSLVIKLHLRPMLISEKNLITRHHTVTVTIMQMTGQARFLHDDRVQTEDVLR